jgi:hypothetical protein
MSYLSSGSSFLGWGLLGNSSRLAALGGSRLLGASLRTSIGLGTLLGDRWLRDSWEDSRAGVPYIHMVQLSLATLRAENAQQL